MRALGDNSIAKRGAATLFYAGSRFKTLQALVPALFELVCVVVHSS